MSEFRNQQFGETISRRSGPRIHAHFLSGVGLLALATIAQPALAQAEDDGTAAEAGQAKSSGNAIIVTANRREQTTRDIPYNISAVGAEQLETARAFDYGSISRLVPGISYVDQGPIARYGNNSFTLRGLNIQSASNNAGIPLQGGASVSTYLDETPTFYSFTLKDMERVELLRGPQGTLYGAGSVGGTIRFIPKEPDLNEFSAEFSATTSFTRDSGNPSYGGDVVVNVPLVSDLFALRVAGGYDRSSGFIDALGRPRRDANGVPVPRVDGDLFSGFDLLPRQKDVNDADKWYVRATAKWAPSDTIEVVLRYQHDDSHQDDQQIANPNVASLTVDSAAGNWPGSLFPDASSCAVATAFPGNYYCGVFLPYADGSTTFPATGENEHLGVSPEPYDSNADLMSLDIDIDVGFATLTSATSYVKVQDNYRQNSTGLFHVVNSPGSSALAAYYGYYPRLADQTQFDYGQENLVEEMRLVSNWDRPWNFILGGFYQRLKSNLSLNEGFPGISEFDSNLFMLQANPQFGDTVFTQQRSFKFEDYAIFGELSFDLTNRLTVTGGARQFWQKLDTSLINQAVFCGVFCASDAVFDEFGFPISGDPLGTTSVGPVSDKVNDHIFKVNLSYDVDDRTLAYFTWSEGFRRGGANSIPLGGNFASLPSFATYEPDTVENYEIGIKGLLAGRIDYSLALFYDQWDNYQFEALSPSSFSYVINGVKARTKGVEFELAAEVADGLNVDVGYSFTDAKASANFSVFDLPTFALSFDLPPIEGAQIFDGDRFPGVPKHSLQLGVDYKQELSDKGLSLNWHSDASYRSKTASWFNAQSDFGRNYFTMAGFWIWNASLTLDDDNWSAGVFVQNITNERGITGGQHETLVGRSGQYFFVTRPTTVGLSLSFRYR